MMTIPDFLPKTVKKEKLWNTQYIKFSRCFKWITLKLHNSFITQVVFIYSFFIFQLRGQSLRWQNNFLNDYKNVYGRDGILKNSIMLSVKIFICFRPYLNGRLSKKPSSTPKHSFNPSSLFPILSTLGLLNIMPL